MLENGGKQFEPIDAKNPFPNVNLDKKHCFGGKQVRKFAIMPNNMQKHAPAEIWAPKTFV